MALLLSSQEEQLLLLLLLGHQVSAAAGKEHLFRVSADVNIDIVAQNKAER